MAQNNPKAPPPGNLPTNNDPTNNAGAPNKSVNDIKPASAKSTVPPQAENVPEASRTVPSNTIENKKASEVPTQANIQPPVEPPSEPPQMQELDDTTVESLEKRSRIIRLIILVASILIIVGLVFGGIYIYNSWLKSASIDTTTPAEEEQQPEEQPGEESTDRDGDTLPNDWEEQYGLNPDDASDATKDNDFDGLNNLLEFKYKTYPKDSDSDKDGYSDGQEVEGGFNPIGSGKLEGNDNNQVSNTAFLAGSWTGNMQGKHYTVPEISINIRSDGIMSISYNVNYNDEKVDNEGSGEFVVEREINKFEGEIDMQGVAKSGNGTFLLGYNGKINKDNDEISGTWFIIPSSLTAPWMIQDNGTFTLRKS